MHVDKTLQTVVVGGQPLAVEGLREQGLEHAGVRACARCLRAGEGLVSPKTFLRAQPVSTLILHPRGPALLCLWDPLVILEQEALLRLPRNSPKSISRHEFPLFPAGPYIFEIQKPVRK